MSFHPKNKNNSISFGLYLCFFLRNTISASQNIMNHIYASKRRKIADKFIFMTFGERQKGHYELYNVYPQNTMYFEYLSIHIQPPVSALYGYLLPEQGVADSPPQTSPRALGFPRTWVPFLLQTAGANEPAADLIQVLIQLAFASVTHTLLVSWSQYLLLQSYLKNERKKSCLDKIKSVNVVPYYKTKHPQSCIWSSYPQQCPTHVLSSP